MLAEHWARYRFLEGRARGVILDLGCGTGYGCAILARSPGVRVVHGIDQSAEALAWATWYYADPRIEYRKADLERGGWERDLPHADAIVAFEILEHLGDEAPFWSGIASRLRAGGRLWLSTPLGRGRGRPAADPFHIHQLRRSEVDALFAGRWKTQAFGQTGTWIEPWVAGRRYYTILVEACAAEAGDGRRGA